MLTSEKSEFGRELARAMSFYERGLKASQLDLWFDLMASYTLADSLAALRAHMSDPKRGQFAPKPADLIALIQSAQPAPMTGNEAWAIALQAMDEGATVLTNNLIDYAMGACRSVMDAGDKVGARMTFLAAFERIAASGERAVWRVSLGYDQHQRTEVIERAQRMGLISAEHAADLLPPPEPTQDAKAIVGLLTGPKDAAPNLTERNRDRWRKLRDDFRASMAAREQQQEAARVAKSAAFEVRRQSQLHALGMQAGAA